MVLACLNIYLCLQIYESPEMNHHKFIEYYDVRAAEAALRALNRSEIAGKQIKLEPGHPRGSSATWWLFPFSFVFSRFSLFL